MTNIVNLNANNGSQVAVPQKVSVLTGEANTWLLIYSGIAFQRQRAEGSTGFLGIGEETSQTDATVNVTIDNISGILLQSATIASMSNIMEEDTWGQWIVNSSRLALQNNGDLVLTVDTTVIGEGDAEFYAFYYHVSAKVILDEASITGTIRWLKTLATPVTPPYFSISAITHVPGPPGSLGPLSVVVATGTEGSLVSDDTYYYVPYKIGGPLIGKSVSVIVEVSRLSSNEPNGLLLVPQISGPNPVNLTVSDRHATEVNFEVSFLPGPH